VIIEPMDEQRNLVRMIARRRFVAEVPELPGVIAYGETPAQAQMRAAVTALRVVGGADMSASVPAMALAAGPNQGAVCRADGVGRYVAVRGAVCLAAAWLHTAGRCALSDPYAMASFAAGCLQ
jgi:hypothetical protein